MRGNQYREKGEERQTGEKKLWEEPRKVGSRYEERAEEKEKMGVEGRKVKWLVVEEEGRERLLGK